MAISMLVWMALGYLSGSISFAYLAGRILRGIDLREYGTGTLGGTNVYVHVSRPAVFVVGILDILKAFLPTWLAADAGMAHGVVVATGLAAILGHNWSLFVGFKGGRGISAALGVLLVIFPWGAFCLLLMVGIGRLCRATASLALIGFLIVPLLALVEAQPPHVIVAGVAIALIAIGKRLEANGAPPPPDQPLRQTLWRRLWLDRDIADVEAWTMRQPPLNRRTDAE